MFHVELRRFPHQARAFNLSGEELQAKIAGPWVAGETVDWGEREWTPGRARLTIYEGPKLQTDELGMGRGWANATRAGEEVTERVLAQAENAAGRTREWSGSTVEELRQAILAGCAGARLGVPEALRLAGERHPGLRVSDRLALAERAVWELLHHGRVRMVRRLPDGGWEPVEKTQWESVLLAWATWADPAATRVFLKAPDDE
ncbi:MAG: hypothetical protein ACR2IP_08990 [Solirubrobacteraceae bacterium]